MPVSLSRYTTMGVDESCASIIEVYNDTDVQRCIEEVPRFSILGGGSNILLTRYIDTPVVLNRIKGLEILRETSDYVDVRCGAGEVWHSFVTWAVYHNLYGVENLALIPGTVGAAPMQNIGAYGVEQNQVFLNVEGRFLEDGKSFSLDKNECEFGYRESLFKKSLKGKCIITHVTYRLSKKHSISSHYGAINSMLEERSIHQPTVRDIYEVVIDIRRSKLPDPRVIYNSGSFFKNPFVDLDTLTKLQEAYPDMPFYKVSDDVVKIPAAWLIQESGMKGYREGDAGVYEKHALVLVNHGNASGAEMLQVSHDVQNAVSEKFGIQLEPEVNIW